MLVSFHHNLLLSFKDSVLFLLCDFADGLLDLRPSPGHGLGGHEPGNRYLGDLGIDESTVYKVQKTMGFTSSFGGSPSLGAFTIPTPDFALAGASQSTFGTISVPSSSSKFMLFLDVCFYLLFCY